MIAWLRRLCSPCVLGHARHPLYALTPEGLRWECRRCGAALERVLPGQVFTPRQPRIIVPFTRKKRA